MVNMPHFLDGLLDITGPKRITIPPLSRQKPVSARTPPSDRELDALIFGDRPSAPQTQTGTPSGGLSRRCSISGSAGEIEHGWGGNGDGAGARPAVQSFWHPPMNRWRVLCACVVYLGNGISDAAPGALIPYMEAAYGIGYAVVSLIFVANAAGFVAAALVTDALLARWGRARALVLSELLLIAAYVVIVCAPPHFAAVVAAFGLLGFGCAINIALNNVFCSNLDRSTVILGFAHGSYGIGGTIAPIVATALVGLGVAWSRFYFLTLGVRVVCVVFNAWAFRNLEQERHSGDGDGDGEDDAWPHGQPSRTGLLKMALRNRTTAIGALFIFMYQGAEVAIAGWVTSFLISSRGGNPAEVGYVTAGFFGGITLGRFALTPFCQHQRWGGERRAVQALTAGALALELLVWHVPDVVSDAVFVALCGLLLGPVYPCAQAVFARLLSGRLQTPSISFIASAGSSGGALLPFATGLLAQASAGTWVLHPICVAAFVAMAACWWALPAVAKRRE